jgi:hypothetical protein
MIQSRYPPLPQIRSSLFLGLLSLSILAGCRRESPETRIREAFAACVRAVEAGDAAAAVDRLSAGFTGPDGMDRAGARLFLAGILRREKVGVTVVAERVEVRGSQAEQEVDLLCTGRAGGSLLPAEGSRKSLAIRWELRDGAWKIRELQEMER